MSTMMLSKIAQVKAKAQHLIQHPNDLLRAERRVIARKLRKIVTGNEKQRIRDLLKEKKKEPKNTKLFDKVSFTLVSSYRMCRCCYFFYTSLSLLMLASRV